MPKVLYKYVRPERIDVLMSKRIRFTQPAATNDPFELRPIFKCLVADKEFDIHVRPTQEILEGALREQYRALPADVRSRLSVDQLLDLVRRNPALIDLALREAMPSIRNMVQVLTPKIRDMLSFGFGRMIGILSLTETATNQAMWAHYADNHRGFLIGFDTSDSYFHRQQSDQDEFNHLRKVRYISRIKPTRSLIDLVGDDVFCTKGEEWAYEREWRMISPLGNELTNPPAEDAVILLDLPASTVCEVILGARAEPELRAGVEQCLSADPQFSNIAARDAYISDDASLIEIREPRLIQR